MKRIIAALLAAVPFSVSACDICGCGAGNSYIGILPEFQKHIIGVRYRTNSMLTHVGAGGTTSYLTTQEKYRTLETWAGWNLTDRVRITMSVPYSFNEKSNTSKNGLGDISLSRFYQFLNKRKTTGANTLLVQSLWIGGGVKLATGEYNATDKTDQSINLFQLGTGSYDISLYMMYDVRLQDAGVNLNAGYKINSSNRFDYSYGNKFSGSAQLYHKFRLRPWLMVAPNAGVQYECSGTDRDAGLQVTASGGNLLLGTLGVEAEVGRVSLGANWQAPMRQNLASGMVRAQNRAMVHVAVSL